MVEISVNSAGYKALFLFFSTDASGSSLLNSVKLNTTFSRYALNMQICLRCVLFFFVCLFLPFFPRAFSCGNNCPLRSCSALFLWIL